MPTFIKTGYWESAVKSYKGWLNLEELISSSGVITGSGTAGRLAFWTSPSVQSATTNLFWDNVNNRLAIGSASLTADFEINKNSTVFQAYRNINSGTNLTTGAIVYQLDILGQRNGGSSSLARSQVVYNGDGITRRGKWIFGVAEASGFGGSSFVLSQTSASTKIVNIGFNAPQYSDSDTTITTTYAQHAQVIVNGTTTLPLMSWDINGVVQNVMMTNGNLLLGTTTDSGYKLDVNGTARVQGGNLASGVRAFVVSATLPDATGLQFGTYLSATSAGTLGRQFAVNIDLFAGYTGIFSTAGFQASNSTQGTGSQPFSGTEYGNVGANLNSVGVTIGTNYGLRSNATGGNVNYGVFANTTGAKTSATNIAVAGFSLNSGATPINIAGYFGLQNVIPTFTSAALVADNGATTSPIFVARDNGVNVFSIVDGGNVLATQYNLSALNTAPATAASTGTLGEIRIDANHIYVCTATNTWKRVAIATW